MQIDDEKKHDKEMRAYRERTVYYVAQSITVPVYLTHSWGPHPHKYALNIQEQEMRCPTGAVTAYQDNLSCMAMVARGRSAAEKTRHIDIRYF